MRPQGKSWRATGVGNEPARRAAIARPTRSGPLAAGRPGRRRRLASWFSRRCASTSSCGTSNSPSCSRREDVEQQLRQEFRTKHAKAVNLDLYKQQLKDIERSFGALLRQLPGKTEVPNLLVDISQTGLSAGLDEKLFQPQPEQRRISTPSCPSRSASPAAITSLASSSAASRPCRASSRCTTSRSTR